MSSQGDLLDVGVWLALNVSNHADHDRAARYWYKEANPPLVFCRTTALGLVRLLCQKTGEKVTPLSLRDAWKTYVTMREVPGVIFSSEPLDVEERLARLVQSPNVSSRLWTDAYLAAFAISAGLRLVTFDKDFELFSGLDFLRLQVA